MKTTSPGHQRAQSADTRKTEPVGADRVGTQPGNWLKPITLAILTVMPFLAAPQLAGETPPKPDNSAAALAFVHVHDADKAMDEAVHEALRTLGKFTTALTTPKSGQRGFAVKKRCTKGDKCEHLWLTAVRFDGRDLRGKVDNDPIELKTPRLGEEVTVQPEEITDWMYIENGRLVGGYTLRVYYSRLSTTEKQQFTKTMGFSLE